MRSAVLAVLLLAASLASAAEHALEVGAEVDDYSGDLGTGDSEFVAYGWDPQGPWRLRLDLSRDARFDDSGLFAGLGATREFGPHALSVGVGSGTADVIHPEYRFDLAGLFALPVPGLQATAGYTRLQSKAENSSDGFHGGLVAWIGGHWILAASGRHDIGHPGDTTSDSADLSVTWFSWLKLYLGAGYRFGSVSYQLLGPDVALVDYDETAVYGTASWYARPDLGVNARVEAVENDVYDLTAVRLSIFKTW